MDVSLLENFDEIKTPRCVLRVHTAADVDDMYQMKTDLSVIRYLDAEPPKDREVISKKIEQIRADFKAKKSLNLIIKLQGSNEAIGFMSFHRFDIKNHRTEIGNALKQKYWNKGIGTEAAIALINYGFKTLNIHSVMANINTENVASRAMLEKLGFQQEALFREDYYFKGKFLDSAILCLIKSDWEAHSIYHLP